MRKKVSLLIMFSILFCINSYTQNTLQLSLNKNVLEKGDTLQITSIFDSIAFKNKAISLQVVIEQLETKKQWKYKFPMLHGIANADFTHLGSAVKTPSISVHLNNPSAITSLAIIAALKSVPLNPNKALSP